MKAQKIVGIAACALACVASVNLLATDIPWFDGNVGDTTTSAISSPEAASWNADPSLPDGVTPAAGSITLDNDQSTPLLLTPAASSEPSLSDGVVTISSTAILTPSDADDLSSMTINSAKAGFAAGIWDNNGVATTNFYGYTSDGWVKLAGADVPNGTATSFKIVLDYRTGKKTVKFFVGDTQLNYYGNASSNVWNIAASATALANVAAYGSGSLSALAATCEKAVVAVGTVKYGSLVDALSDGGSASTIKDVTSSGAITESAVSASGLPVAVCKALGIDTATENPATVKVLPVVNDSDASNITLAMDANQSVETGVAVKFAVKKDNVQVGELFNSNAIKIPLSSGTGVYTVEPADVVAQ